ncbi:MAG: hypothetical protein ACYDIE_07800 [Candidatus Krumholzibacteriia bacterium]
MSRRDRQIIRDADAGDSLEILLITAIGTILGLRVYLQLAHYPQVGGGSLHISHVLWGGLAMMGALVLLLAYWNPAVRRSAAVLAGLGWGAFIDELGKFITRDYDYLFRPTFAVLYLLFMAMFILFWSLTQRRSLSAHELEVNRELRVRLRTAADGRDLGGVIGRLVLGLRGRIDEGYARLTVQPWFEPALIGLFLAVGLTDVGRTIRHLATRAARAQDYSHYEIVATLAANACVWVGIACLRRSRLTAMHWFQRSLVVVMLLTTPLHFYRQQLEAFGGFLWTLVIYLLLRYAIRREARAA